MPSTLESFLSRRAITSEEERAREVTETIAWLEGISEAASYDALVEMNRRLDHWFNQSQAGLCRQLLERLRPEKVPGKLLVGLLMNSVRGGEEMTEPRRAFRERIRGRLVEEVGDTRATRILERIAC